MDYATTFAHVLFVSTLLPCMAFYLQQQVLNTRRHSLVPLVSTIVGTATNVVLSLYFLRGFTSEPLNATDLPLGNHSSYLGAAIARGASSVVMVIITGAYMILSRDQICPFGCLCCAPTVRRRRRGGRRDKKNHRHHGEGDGSEGSDDDNDDESEPELLPEAEQNFWAWEGGFQLLLALCGPSMLLMISEWWGFEALAIMAGNLPNGAVCLDGNGVLYNINVLMYQVHRGFGVGASVYVGNSIGRKCDLRLAGGGLRDVAASFGTSKDDVTIGGDDDDDDGLGGGRGGGGGNDDSADDDDDSNLDDALVQAAARDAKTFCWTGLLGAVVVQLLLSTAYYFLREQLASIFTDDQDVVGMSSNATIAAAAAAVGYAMVMPANMVCCLRRVGAGVRQGRRVCIPRLCAREKKKHKISDSGEWWGGWVGGWLPPQPTTTTSPTTNTATTTTTAATATPQPTYPRSCRSLVYACTHARMRARMHARTRPRTPGAARPRAPDGGRGDHHVWVLRRRAAAGGPAGLHRQDGAQRHLVGQCRGARLVGRRNALVHFLACGLGQGGACVACVLARAD